MAQRMPPPKLAARPPKPPPDQTEGAEPKRPAAEKKQLPDKAEVNRLIAELRAGLNSNDEETRQEAARICRSLSLRAVERLGLIITGGQSATPPQVVMASIAILKGARVVKDDAGATAEITE